MKLSSFLYAAVLGTVVAGLSSCKKYLDLDPPGSITTDRAYGDSANVNRVLLAAYNLIQSGDIYGGNLVHISELLGDNVEFNTIRGTSGDASFADRTFGNLTNNPASGTWNSAYAAIYRCNLVLGATNGGTFKATQGTINQLKGEAYFIRALMHHELVRLFARPYADPNRASNPGVPIRISTPSANDAANGMVPRAPVAQVYAQIISDLDQAIANLEPATTDADAERGTKDAAYALRARVAFDMQDYAAAAQYADQALTGRQGTLTSLLAPFRNQLGKSSGGVFFEIANVSNDDAAGDLRSRYYNVNANNVPNQIDSSDDGDPKAYVETLMYALRTGGQMRLDTLIVASGPIKYTKKWRGTSPAGQLPTDVPVLRAAEMYLTRAESRAQTGNEGGAREDDNKIRTLAGSVLLNEAITGQALLDSIRLDRRRELFFEGDRFNELRRLGLNTGPRHNFPANSGVLPLIPLGEVNGNPGIVQNDAP